MKVLKARTKATSWTHTRSGEKVPRNWRWEVLVDHMPDNQEMADVVFKQMKDGDNSLLIGELDGYVRFLYAKEPPCPTRDYRGACGGTFLLEDGTRYTVKDGWSSRAGCFNQFADEMGWPEVVDVSITDDPQAWDRGYTFYAGHITLAALQEWADDNDVEIERLPSFSGGKEHIYMAADPAAIGRK